MSSQSDQVLLDRYALSRSDSDFRPLVDRYATLVYAACVARLGRRELAEDAAQAVFVLLARKAPKMRASPTLAPWLLTACRNISMRLSRSERRRVSRELPLDETLAAPAFREEIGVVDALERLRGDDRDAVVLRFVQNLSLSEVGDQLGISEDAARMRVGRALARLRRDLAPLAAVTPSFVARLSRPLAATTLISQLATQGSMMNPTNLFLLVPVGAAMALGASTFGSHDAAPNARPVVASSQPKPAIPSERTKAVLPAVPTRGRQLRFEEYLGKNQAWFERRFGPSDGGTGLGGSRPAGPAPLEWRTYDRRPDLGGGKWQLASAAYPIGEDPERPMLKVLSITFEGPAGGRPVATRVDHGVDPKPSRSFEQEAAYVGVNLADYDGVQPDRSNAEDRRMINRKHPEIVLTANDLNDTWHISLQLDPKARR